MTRRMISVILLAIPLFGCFRAGQIDEVARAQAAAAAQSAAATPAAAAPAAAVSLSGLTQFTIVDPNGIQSGTFQNIGGTAWQGPDIVRGGQIRFAEEFKRDDQMVLAAVRQGAADDWDVYEVSIQSGGRVYFAYRSGSGDFAGIPDHTATGLQF